MRTLLLALVLAACADQKPTPAPPPTVQLEGTQWVSSAGGLNAPTIAFSGSRANGFTGCNLFFAQVEQNGPMLRFSAVGTTRRACSPDLTEIERAFVAQLESTNSAHIDGDVLVLQDVNRRELARFTRQP